MKNLNTDEELIAHLDKITIDFQGQLNELEAAIGYFVIGRHFGWKPLLLIHDKSTLKKYESILQLNIRDELPEIGEYAYKSNAWRAVQKIKSFWKAVKGEVPGIRSQEVN
jgi:hypothetical protein